MKNIKDELQNIILGDEPTGRGSQLKKSKISLEDMRKQAAHLKTSSVSKTKKQQHS